MPIRIAIVDDQAIIRSGLSVFIRSSDQFVLVGEAANGEEAIQLCELVKPEIMLMDVKMPVMDGITATRHIHQRWPEITVLVLTNYVEKGLAQKALEAGASGYIVKDVTAEELITALQKMYHERQPLILQQPASSELIAVLEQLERSLESEVVDTSRLSGLLRRHLPPALPGCHIEVRLFPEQELLTFPAEGVHQMSEAGWRWLHTQSSLRVVHAGSAIPWDERQQAQHDLILAPIVSDTNRQPLGGLAIWPQDTCAGIGYLLPAIEGLSAPIARGMRQSYRTPEPPGRQGLAQELAAAARIQIDLLPARMPSLRGWDFAAQLKPALETSGDFYDLIPLANNNLGLAIADVSDKGMGAALFMALSSTLLRTYAVQYPSLPALSISTVNERILADSRSGMFVTAFYAVLEPNTGRLRYVNAGHNPPLLISHKKSKTIDQLKATGMALGVMGEMIWRQKVIRMLPGDVLLMYTDGLTDAQDARGNFYDEHRLLNVVRKSANSAKEILQAVLDDLDRFTGGLPSLDDVTLLVVRRE
jgi:DNA-binding NarL/FixJ family response regulator